MLEKKGLPKGWIKTTIERVCTAPQYGWTTSAQKYGNLHLLRTTDITTKHINWNNVPYCKQEPQDITKYLLHDGDIVISRAGSVGFSYLIDKPKKSIFASYLIRFKPLINKHFFAYFLNSDCYWREITNRSVGIALANVNATKLKQIPILLPPLNEQHRIVQKIESIFAQIDACRSRLERLVPQTSSVSGSLAQLKDSVLKQAFEGNLVPQNPSDESVEELLMRIGKNTGKNVVFEKEGLPEGWISIKFENITPHSQPFNPVTEKNQKYVGLEHIEKDTGKIIGHADSNMTLSTKTVFSKGDLLYGKLRPYLNKVTIAEFNGVCSTDILVFPKNPFIINDLLKFCFLKSDFVQFANNTMSGVQHPRTSHKKLSNYRLQIPPLQEQHRIVHKIESIFARIDAKQKELEMLESCIKSIPDSVAELKSSILKMAFDGNLVPQDPNDEPAEELLKRLQVEKSG